MMALSEVRTALDAHLFLPASNRCWCGIMLAGPLDHTTHLADDVIGPLLADTARDTLLAAADAGNEEWLDFQAGWGSNERDQHALAFGTWIMAWLRARAGGTS